MMKPMLHFESKSQGFALVAVLLLMVALSLVGVAALRNVSLQEKMAGNLYFRMISFQDAEGGLRKTTAYMDSQLGATASAPPAPLNSDANWRDLNPKGSDAPHWRSTAAWSGTAAYSPLNSTVMNGNAVTESLGTTGQIIPCEVNNQKTKACDVLMTRMSVRVQDPATGATSIVQQHWSFPSNR
jgi:Tfp pilus assembly protein PilX